MLLDVLLVEPEDVVGRPEVELVLLVVDVVVVLLADVLLDVLLDGVEEVVEVAELLLDVLIEELEDVVERAEVELVLLVTPVRMLPEEVLLRVTPVRIVVEELVELSDVVVVVVVVVFVRALSCRGRARADPAKMALKRANEKCMLKSRTTRKWFGATVTRKSKQETIGNGCFSECCC